MEGQDEFRERNQSNWNGGVSTVTRVGKVQVPAKEF